MAPEQEEVCLINLMLRNLRSSEADASIYASAAKLALRNDNSEMFSKVLPHLKGYIEGVVDQNETITQEIL